MIDRWDDTTGHRQRTACILIQKESLIAKSWFSLLPVFFSRHKLFALIFYCAFIHFLLRSVLIRNDWCAVAVCGKAGRPTSGDILIEWFLSRSVTNSLIISTTHGAFFPKYRSSWKYKRAVKPVLGIFWFV